MWWCSHCSTDSYGVVPLERCCQCTKLSQLKYTDSAKVIQIFLGFPAPLFVPTNHPTLINFVAVHAEQKDTTWIFSYLDFGRCNLSASKQRYYFECCLERKSKFEKHKDIKIGMKMPIQCDASKSSEKHVWQHLERISVTCLFYGRCISAAVMQHEQVNLKIDCIWMLKNDLRNWNLKFEIGLSVCTTLQCIAHASEVTSL